MPKSVNFLEEVKKAILKEGFRNARVIESGRLFEKVPERSLKFFMEIYRKRGEDALMRLLERLQSFPSRKIKVPPAREALFKKLGKRRVYKFLNLLSKGNPVVEVTDHYGRVGTLLTIRNIDTQLKNIHQTIKDPTTNEDFALFLAQHANWLNKIKDRIQQGQVYIFWHDLDRPVKLLQKEVANFEIIRSPSIDWLYQIPSTHVRILNRIK